MQNSHICPECSSKTKVTDSRNTILGWHRRRTCPKCGIRYSTYEVSKDQIMETAKVLRKENRRLKLLIRSIEDLTKGGQT